MSDIHPYGSTEGLGWYWVRSGSTIGNAVSAHLELVVIDELGNINWTGNRRADEPAGREIGEAVREHLASGIAEANADLDRRRADLPEQAEPEPPPEQPDPATRRFFDDDADD